MEFKKIRTYMLVPNPDQPREHFEKDEIRELSKSISSVGEIQPLIVRKRKKNYEIIAGERRWRAAKMARISEIPAIIIDVKDEDVLLISLIENLHRKDLSSTERENAVYDLWVKYGKDGTGRWKSRKQLAKSLGKDVEWVGYHINASVIRKKVKISKNVSTATIRATRSLGEKDRKTILKKVDKGKIKPSKVKEAVEVYKKAPESLKRAVVKDEIPLKRATEAVKIYEKAKRVGRTIPKGKIKSHVNQMKMEAKEDKLRERVRKRSHEGVLTGKKKSVDVTFDEGEAEKFINEVEDVVWAVQSWGVPIMMVVGEKAWNKSRKHFKTIHKRMEFLLGKEYKRKR